MTFQYTVEDLASESGDGTEEFTFDLRDVADIPVGILRQNRRNQENQMWAVFEWGVPVEQMDAFDRLTSLQVGDVFAAWKASPSEPKQVDQDKPVGPPPTPKSKKAVAVEPDPEPVTDE